VGLLSGTGRLPRLMFSRCRRSWQRYFDDQLRCQKGSTDNLCWASVRRKLFHHRAGHAQRSFTHK